jgi:hypothetical protein
MKLSKSTVTITALALLSLGLGAALAHRYMQQPVIYADHVQQLRMDVANEVLRVRLGSSDLPNGPAVTNPQEAGSLALTPRAAIQLQVELSRLIKLIHEAAKAQQADLVWESEELPGKPLPQPQERSNVL